MNKIIAIALAAIAFPAVANATGDCGNKPQGQWISKAAIQAKAEALGYQVRQVKIEGGCYEVKAIKNGAKVETVFDPVTGKIVRDENGEGAN